MRLWHSQLYLTWGLPDPLLKSNSLPCISRYGVPVPRHRPGCEPWRSGESYSVSGSQYQCELRNPLQSFSSACSQRRSSTSFIGKMETLAWTAHMDDSLSVVERENEYSSDAVLVTMVKIQLVGEEVQKLMRRKINEGNQNPTYIFKPGLVSRLNEIRSQLPDRLANNRAFSPQHPPFMSTCSPSHGRS